MVKNKVYLFRHGQTYYNKNKYFTGWIDSKLTKEGFRNARILAEKLKKKRIDVGFCTELSRSVDTLKEVLVYHPECKRIIEANRMIERSYGDLSGKKHRTIIKKYGQAQYDKWHRGYNERPPDGESFKDVEKRVRIFINNLKLFMEKENVNVAISAHGNSIRVFRKIIEKKTQEQAQNWVIPYEDYFEYSF